ncbi:MAG TPA: pyruvate dehydrogenase complex dihydrolipoamide acetyltransferase [Allosphingosinicella sp.]|jgi:pyruvate dehydrogenase E2 component (dihydrolipoamide acetyltransferase)
MPIELKMPALSPTMEEGTLAKWLVKEGDKVSSGTLLAEIETDKATMEFEAIDEGTIAQILVAEGTDEVKVGTVIAIIAGEGEDVGAPAQAPAPAQAVPTGGGETGAGQPAAQAPTPQPDVKGYGANPAEDRQIAAATASVPPQAPPRADAGERVKASPLARRLAEQKGIDLAGVTGSGPGGRIVKADIDGAQQESGDLREARAERPQEVGTQQPTPVRPEPVEGQPSPSAPKPQAIPDIPHEAVKLSNVRKTIARRLTESKQTVPHIYLTVDIQLDALLKLRTELNASLDSRGVKLSVNDFMIKALAVALIDQPKCNVMFTPTELITFKRADISVAVSTPTGLITPIIVDAGSKSLSAISTEMKDLAARARDNKLQPQEYQGGTASLSNMGMYGIKDFGAVINPPQAMIMAIGAGEQRPYVIDGALAVATVMSATGSFDHRAIDGADGAALMKRFKELVESPLGMIA